MNRVNKFYYNLNLAREYVPKWGLFEGLREFYANMVDADENFTLDFPSDDECIMSSASNPSLENMFILGDGSKSEKTDTIGRFGEGAKVGALALTRRKNTKLVISSPHYEVTFEFRKAPGLTKSTLHACVDPKIQTPRYTVRIEATGIKEVYYKNFLARDAAIGPYKKNGGRGMRVYVRNILIKRIEERSLFDWNLDTVELNRDRDMPDAWDLKWKIGGKLVRLCTDDAMADLILNNPNTYEAQALKQYGQYDTDAKQAMTAAFHRKYGETAVLSVDDSRINTLAQYKGNRPIAMGELSAVLNVKSASDIVSQSDKLTVSKSPVPDYVQNEVRIIADIIGVPCFITSFVDDDKTLGLAKTGVNCAEVWLNERLFQPGQRLLRLRTICHELGHIKGGGDADIEFECSLDLIAGKLAEYVISH